MEAIRRISTYILLLFFFSSCHVFSSDEQRELNTIRNVLECIKNLNEDCVLSYAHTTVDSRENIRNIAKWSYYYIKKYHNGSIDSIEYLRYNQPDGLGRIKYEFLLFKGLDSMTADSFFNLEIYIGPKQIIGLEKITGIELNYKIDEQYRNRLSIEGKIYKIDQLLDQLDSR